MSGPQSTLSGVVSLWVSERPSVMTRAIRSFWVGGRSRSRVYCRASPVNVPPAIHCSFLTALRGHGAVSARGRARGQGPGQVQGQHRGQSSGLGLAPGLGELLEPPIQPAGSHSLLELLSVPDVRAPHVHVLLHLVVAVLHHACVRLPGLKLHGGRHQSQESPGCPCPLHLPRPDLAATLMLVGWAFGS